MTRCFCRAGHGSGRHGPASVQRGHATRRVEARPDWLDWTGLDWTGLDWTELDWTALDWIRLG